MDLRAEILAIFMELGFTRVGFARPDPPDQISTYLNWIDHGYHAGMGYLAQARAVERRADPQLILPEAKTVVVLVLPYENPDTANILQETGPHGRVAAYAWGQDYHEVIPPRLETALDRMQELLGARPIARGYTDTGPILERSFAQSAGLGWIGKNTCLIIPGSGSYVLLAELFLSIEIEPDEPFRSDHCGSCTRCIDACPTACIRPDRTIDSGRCISYLTIENKAAIPTELRPSVGDWVFGCDICQQVCPWNQRFAPAHGDPALAARAGLPRPDLIADLGLTPQEFKRKFMGTPLTRAKRRGYLRNLAVAAGNSGDPAAVPALEERLASESEPLVRMHAAWALGQIEAAEARDALQRAQGIENDPAVRLEIEQALLRRG